MLINELSKKTGISTHTIRFYEKSGLIEGKQDESVKSNNYYHYDDVTVEKLEFISDAKSVGFTIKEIGQIIDAWYNRKYTKKQKLASELVSRLRIKKACHVCDRLCSETGI
jgi:MerR family transcriptional regulator, copper efflux regulator